MYKNEWIISATPLKKLIIIKSKWTISQHNGLIGIDKICLVSFLEIINRPT